MYRTRVVLMRQICIEQLDRQDKDQRSYIDVQLQQLQTNLTSLKHSSIKNSTSIADLQQALHTQTDNFAELLQQESNARALLEKEIGQQVHLCSERNQSLALRSKKLKKHIKEVQASLSQELTTLAKSQGNTEIIETLQQTVQPPELPLDQI